MPWIARLENGAGDFMEVQIQDTVDTYDPENGRKISAKENAHALAQRQNEKFAEEFNRPLYELVSLERVKA